MAQNSIDRRVARTRQTLQRSLKRLTLMQGYEATTVTDICDAAKVGRSTFYSHYADKDDLKRGALEHLRDELAAARTAAGADQPFAFSLPMFAHARSHLAAYRALSGNRGGVVALATIREILSDLVRADLANGTFRCASDRPTREFAVQYLVGAFMATMTWWLDDGAKVPPTLMDAMFRNLATKGVAAI